MLGLVLVVCEIRKFCVKLGGKRKNKWAPELSGFAEILAVVVTQMIVGDNALRFDSACYQKVNQS